MKTSEIRELNKQELLERIEAEQVNLTRLKMNHSVSPLDNPNQIIFTRRLVARLKTEQRMREMNETQKSE